MDTITRTRPNEILYPGRVVGAGNKGQKFLITGIKSGVNYSAVEVHADGSFGVAYNLRRSSSFIDFGQDNDMLAKYESGQGTVQPMGAVVLIKQGQYTGLHAIVAEVKRDYYILAVPGKTSIRQRFNGVEAVEADGMTWVLNCVD